VPLVEEISARLDAAARESFVERSDALGELLEVGLTQGELPKVREAAEGLEALLASLGPLESEGARRVLALARAHGSTGKISGAGGGDGCVLFSPDPDAQRALLGAFAARSIPAMPLTLEPGLKGEYQPDALLQRFIAADA
jgi:phosphomevalonate kinase